MPSREFTHRTVQGLKPPAAGRVDYFDADPPGFGLRLSPTTKTWFYLYRSPTLKMHGQPWQRRLKLGTFPATSLKKARAAAKRAQREVEANVDPGETKIAAREAGTFADLADDFQKRYRKRDGSKKISADEDARIIAVELLPAWEHRSAKDITRQDVKRLAQAIADRPAPVQANRVVALISTIFNFAVDEGLAENNPAYRIKKFGAEKSRERVLSEDELRELWTALEAEHPVYRAFYRFAIATAQRMGGKRKERGEILWMKWAEVDDATHWWTIPGARTKNGLMHRVYLTETARAQIDAMKAYQKTKEITSDFVFTTPRSKTQPVTGAKHIIRRIRERIAATREAENLTDRPALDFRPHDLRRTVATMLTSRGIPRSTVKKILNHTDDEVTAIYDRYGYDSEVQQAWEKWDRLLRAIVAKKKSGAAVLRMPAR